MVITWMVQRFLHFPPWTKQMWAIGKCHPGLDPVQFQDEKHPIYTPELSLASMDGAKVEAGTGLVGLVRFVRGWLVVFGWLVRV